MSLQVWLPLNGDLRNQGCNNPSISLTSGNTWASSGKIGNSSLTLTKLQTILPTFSCMTGAKEVSYCYWVKVNTAWSTNWLDGIRWIETDGSATSTARQEFYTNCTLVGTWYKGGSIAGKAFTPGVWTHLAATFNYNTGEANFYIDGVLKGTTTNIDKTYHCRGDFYIGDNGVDICQNDVRIYDHCLSAAEVHEISQGLVLHYKLNQPIVLTDAILNQDTYTVYNNYAGSGTTGTLTNLSETFNGHVVRREVMTPNDTSVNNFKASLGSHGVYGHRQTFLANTKYVFWIYYRPISHTDIRAGGTASNIGGWTEIPPVAVGDGWYRVGQYRNGTVTTDKTDNIFTSFYTPTAASGVPITIDWAAPHLLVGTTEIPDDDSFMGNDYVEDSSGYEHNGTITGTLTLNSNTARYSAATYFNGTDAAIQIPFNDCIKTDDYTVSVWTYKSVIGEKAYQTILGGPSGFELEARSNTSTSPLYRIHNWGGGTTAYDLNKWNLFTFVRTASDSKLYVNGELKLTGTAGNAPPSGNYFIGAWKTATQQNYDGYMSDFRIYTTALSADDILQLYHTGAKIGNKADFHTYEINESGTNKLTKTGIMYDNMEESIMTLPDGSHWQLLMFHYVDDGKNLFTSSNANNCNDFGLFSRLKDIDDFKLNNRYEFYAIQDDTEYRWIQTNAPLTTTSVAGFSAVSGYNSPGAGICKCSGNTLLARTNSTGNWWNAFGCYTLYSGGIPGLNQTVCKKYLALYARIEKADVKLSNQTANTSEFIEL